MVGPVLDIQRGMKPVTCAVAPDPPPNRRETRQSQPRTLSHAGEKHPRRVLVVDDEPLIRWSVCESLSELDYDIEQASDAASALRTITTAALPFDVVVLDLRLPDMDDLSLLATLRQLIPRARLVLMTAFGTPELFSEARALGAGVINKPFELEELSRLVRGGAQEAA
jgi:DNA-binding NtrC family response regulator